MSFPRIFDTFDTQKEDCCIGCKASGEKRVDAFSFLFEINDIIADGNILLTFFLHQIKQSNFLSHFYFVSVLAYDTGGMLSFTPLE